MHAADYRSTVMRRRCVRAAVAFCVALSALCSVGCRDSAADEAKQRIAAYQTQCDTPIHAAKSLADLLDMQIQQRPTGDREALRAIIAKMSDVVAVDRIERALAEHIQQQRAGLAEEEFHQRIVAAATDTWPGLIAFYCDGLDWEHAATRVSAANPSDCTVVVPARGKDGRDNVMFEARCIKRDGGDWRVTDIRLVPTPPKTTTAPAATQPSAAPTEIIPR